MNPRFALRYPGPLRRWRFTLLPVLLISLWNTPAAAFQSSEWAWGGRLKSVNLHLDAGPKGWADGGEVSSNSLRLTLSGQLPHRLAVDLAVQTGLLATHPAGLAQAPENNGQRIVDLSTTWGEQHTLSGQVDIDRLSLSGQSEHLDWTLGRQAIGFGRILLFSPLDVIAPFAPDAIDTEIRPGVDALKIRGYFVQTGEIGAYAVLAGRRRDWSGLLTFTWNSHGIDILGIAGRLRDRPMGGLGLAGEAGGLGLKAEAAVYGGKRVSQPGGDLHSCFTIGAFEAWYRFDNGLVLTGQYLYNGAGANRPADYLKAADSAPVREGLSYLLGNHYLMLAPSYELHPLVTLSGLAILNLDDRSCLVRPAVTVSLSDNLSLMVFWAAHAGDAPRTPYRARSEFGIRGDGGGAFLAWHF